LRWYGQSQREFELHGRRVHVHGNRIHLRSRRIGTHIFVRFRDNCCQREPRGHTLHQPMGGNHLGTQERLRDLEFHLVAGQRRWQLHGLRLCLRLLLMPSALVRRLKAADGCRRLARERTVMTADPEPCVPVGVRADGLSPDHARPGSTWA